MAEGSRARGRPKLRFKDKCKISMSRCNIDHKTWEQLAADRSSWKSAVTLGTKYHENAIIFGLEAKRQRRKNGNPEPCGTQLTCRNCSRSFTSTLAGSTTRDAARVNSNAA